jgi:hypothetical protein
METLYATDATEHSDTVKMTIFAASIYIHVSISAMLAVGWVSAA